MPRVRRKTPHQPVAAVPNVADRVPLARDRACTPRSLAAALNRGRPRVAPAPLPPPSMTPAPAASVPPLRDRLATRAGIAELLVFRIAGETFALELRAVEEAVEEVRVRPIPDAPSSLLGVFPLRERTIPVYAPAPLLGLPGGDDAGLAIVVRAGDTRLALMVDAVDDVFEIRLDAVRPAPAPTTDASDGIVLGIVWRGRELVALLDAGALLDLCTAVRTPDSL